MIPVAKRASAIAQGYEDLNDHKTLRKDSVFQIAADRDAELASPSSLCRFENRADQDMLWNMSGALVDVFIESFDRAREELILDFDSTDDAVHGQQLGRFFTVIMIITVFLVETAVFGVTECLTGARSTEFSILSGLPKTADF